MRAALTKVELGESTPPSSTRPMYRAPDPPSSIPSRRRKRRSTRTRSASSRPPPTPTRRRRSSTWCSRTRAGRWKTPASAARFVSRRERTVPAPLLVPPPSGCSFSSCRWWGWSSDAPWSALGPALAEPEVRQALRLSLVSATLATLLSLVLKVPLRWVLARSRIAVAACSARWSPCPSCCRRRRGRRAVPRAGAAGDRRALAVRTVRRDHPVHDRGRRHRRDVRGDAVPGDQRRRGTACRRRTVRGRRGHPRRRPLDDVPA